MNRISYRISGRLVQVTLEGENTGEAILETLKQAMEEAGGAQNACLLLVDARAAATSRPTGEVRSIATRFIRLTSMVDRLAVITASDFHHGLARVALAVAETGTLAATACRTLAQACEFLGVAPADIVSSIAEPASEDRPSSSRETFPDPPLP